METILKERRAMLESELKEIEDLRKRIYSLEDLSESNIRTLIEINEERMRLSREIIEVAENLKKLIEVKLFIHELDR